MSTKTDGPLSLLYENWVKDPKSYEDQLRITIDKIIYSTLGRQKVSPYYWRYEDREDMIQDLRVLCWRRLNKIKPPITNKRLFNYLRITIVLALKERARKIGKILDRENLETKVLGVGTSIQPEPFSFGDAMLDQVATLLVYKASRKDISRLLDISTYRVNWYIGKLRAIYKEKSYEKGKV